jgi:formate hydrogenlyase subunit 4
LGCGALLVLLKVWIKRSQHETKEEVTTSTRASLLRSAAVVNFELSRVATVYIPAVTTARDSQTAQLLTHLKLVAVDKQ